MPGVPGYPGADLPEPMPANVHRTIHDLAGRLAVVERHVQHLPQLVKDVSDTKEYLAGIKSLEALAKHLVSRTILLILGAVGGTYGFTRVTTQSAPVEHTQIIKSATTVRVEACTAMQPGPLRDQCALDLLRDLMTPSAH